MHFNLSTVMCPQEVRELRYLYVDICVFCSWFLKSFFFPFLRTVFWMRLIFKHIHLIHIQESYRYKYFWSEWTILRSSDLEPQYAVYSHNQNILSLNGINSAYSKPRQKGFFKRKFYFLKYQTYILIFFRFLNNMNWSSRNITDWKYSWTTKAVRLLFWTIEIHLR